MHGRSRRENSLGRSCTNPSPIPPSQRKWSATSAAVIGPTASLGAKGRKNRSKGTPAPPPEPVLAEPSGPCANSDVVVTPALTTAVGGSDIPITLNARTQETEACTWTASAETMTVTITSGTDHIWSSRECPASIAPTDVVVRRAVDTPLTVTWHARRSDETCSPVPDYAYPGWYHVEAAALGGEPTDVQFELVAPEAPVVTKTVEPKPGKAPGKKAKRGERREHRAGDDGGGNSDG